MTIVYLREYLVFFQASFSECPECKSKGNHEPECALGNIEAIVHMLYHRPPVNCRDAAEAIAAMVTDEAFKEGRDDNQCRTIFE